MTRILVDVCVVLDVLDARLEFLADAWEVFETVLTGKVEGFVTADALTNIFYMVRRHFAARESAYPVGEAKQALRHVLMSFGVLDTTGDDCRRALDAPISDFEDAVAVEVAQSNGIDWIITRNIRDFRDCGLEVMTPVEYLERMDD